MYQRILVPVDGSQTSRRGLQEAIEMARLTGGTIRLLHVLDQMADSYTQDACSAYVGDWIGALEEEGRKLLEEAKASVAASGLSVQAVLRQGMERRFHEIVQDEVVAWKADLIVIGTHGRKGINRLLLGSDAERVVRTANVPVLLVRLPDSVETDVGETKPEIVHVRLPSAALAFE